MVRTVSFAEGTVKSCRKAGRGKFSLQPVLYGTVPQQTGPLQTGTHRAGGFSGPVAAVSLQPVPVGAPRGDRPRQHGASSAPARQDCWALATPEHVRLPGKGCARFPVRKDRLVCVTGCCALTEDRNRGIDQRGKEVAFHLVGFLAVGGVTVETNIAAWRERELVACAIQICSLT